jgi:hypothetical protein
MSVLLTWQAWTAVLACPTTMYELELDPAQVCPF